MLLTRSQFEDAKAHGGPMSKVVSDLVAQAIDEADERTPELERLARLLRELPLDEWHGPSRSGLVLIDEAHPLLVGMKEEGEVHGEGDDEWESGCVQTADGTKRFAVGADLRERWAKVPVGTFVAVTYDGRQTLSNGRVMRKYRLHTASPDDVT